MKIELSGRTEAHVRVYFDRTRDEEIQRMCPQQAKTAEEAVRDFEKTLLPDSRSFGRTVYADGSYVGDVWLYCMHEEDGPDAMLSFCIFEKKIWGRGAATEAVRLFLEETGGRFGLWTVGTFIYCENAGSRRVLEKNGFILREAFCEDGRESAYYEKELVKT